MNSTNTKTKCPYCLYIGIDWADEKHDICSSDTVINSDNPGKHMVLSSEPKVVRAWFEQARKKFPQGRFAVGVELCRGPIINLLVNFDYVDIYPINPNTLAQYRRAFAVSGAKDDVRDARIALDLVMLQRNRLTKLELQDATVRELSMLCEKRRQIVGERTRYNNKLKAVLKTYYPLFLKIIGEDLYADMALSLFDRFPTYEKLKKSRNDTIRKEYHTLKCYRKSAIEKRIEIINSSESLTNDPAVVDPAVMEAKLYVNLLRQINKTIAEYDLKIRDLFPSHEDAAIFSSLPGAGDTFAPRLLCAFGANRTQITSAADMQKCAGIAPVRIASGKSHVVKWRYGCSKYLRQTFIEFAKSSIGHSLWAQAYYHMQLDRGKSHQAAVRALAFKWIRVIFYCWQSKTEYNEMNYLKQLQKHSSPLLKYFGKTSLENT